MCEVGKIRNVLHQQRAVEAQFVPQLGDLLGSGTFGDQQQCGIAGEPHDEEDNGQHAERGDDGLANAAGKVSDHEGLSTEANGHRRKSVTAATSCP